MDLTTRVIEGSGLSIPIFDGAHNNGKGRYLSEPEIIKNSLLEQMFEPEELQSLLLVKIDHRNPDANHLRSRNFADGTSRRLTFSSGNSYYFADDDLCKKIRRMFATEPDTACRYGSLLVSNCYKGSDTLENLRVKIVDFNDPEYAHYKTGDCHGKISPQLAYQLGGEQNCPFQFRFAWRKQWAEEHEESCPRVSFLSKGTLLPDARLTDAEGYDIIMDRSSIKGIKKVRLDELVPCGDYEFPQAAMGNRGNARATSYDNSWQFTIWYSEDAVRQDLKQPTEQKAKVLADLQRNPLALARYIVQEYDKEQQRRQERSEEDFEDEDGNANSQVQESRWISLLRSDKYGQLVETPKFRKFATDYVAGRWRDLAIKSGYSHSSGMAMPSDDLPRGTVCVPHLPEGDVILTRYPIVNSDNIRLYHNSHDPELKKTRNVIWINPKDAEEHHQADFDGDQLMVSSASQLPNLAKETLRAGEPGRFEAVKQRPKLAYSEVVTDEGGLKYQNLAQIAAAANQNKVGLVATNIGRVQSSMPGEGENVERFERRQCKLLNRLFQALQVEVDSPKSAERLEDIKEIEGENLLSDAKRWSESHPSHFFDFKKDDRLYRSFAMPADAPGSVNVLAREVVNPLWEPTRIRSRDRHEFRYLFPKDGLSVDALEWAEELKTRFQQARDEIQERVGEDRDAFNEELGKLYDSYRAEINELFPTTEERFEGAAALWYTQHTRPEMDRHRRDCLALAEQMDITFALQHGYEVPSEALPRDAYVLSVPFGSDAIRWKETLEQKGIQFDAMIHPQLPMIEFALKYLPLRLVEKLEAKFGQNVNDLDTLRVPDDLRIIPPADHTWAESRQDSGVGALAYNLLTEEVCQQLQAFQFDEIKVLGIRHNDFAGENFASKQWRNQTVSVQVWEFELPESHPEYYRYNGTPIVQIDDKNLGTFSPDTPKLPIGSSFEANLRPEGSSVVLKLNPDSIQLPELVLPGAEAVQSSELDRDQWRKEMFSGLVTAVATTYEQRRSGDAEIAQFKVGDKWTAYVQPTGDFIVRNEAKRTICRGNLNTGEETVSLSEEYAGELERMLVERDQVFYKNRWLSPHLSHPQVSFDCY
jgi:RNA dependent RNA polymerase